MEHNRARFGVAAAAAKEEMAFKGRSHCHVRRHFAEGEGSGHLQDHAPGAIHPVKREHDHNCTPEEVVNLIWWGNENAAWFGGGEFGPRAFCCIMECVVLSFRPHPNE
jgi:hypothetical protein